MVDLGDDSDLVWRVVGGDPEFWIGSVFLGLAELGEGFSMPPCRRKATGKGGCRRDSS
ncbi:MAG: hypothetical protein WBE76_19455 [Terracidiphilus sp.]